MAALSLEAGFPPGVINVLPGWGGIVFLLLLLLSWGYYNALLVSLLLLLLLLLLWRWYNTLTISLLLLLLSPCMVWHL